MKLKAPLSTFQYAAVGADVKLTHGADFRCPTDNLLILFVRNVLRRVQEGQCFSASWVNLTSAPTSCILQAVDHWNHDRIFSE